MNKRSWISFVATRYVSRGRSRSPSPVFSVLGIAVGVLALTIIIAVMNGFQLGFIENILEISSFHVRVEGIRSTDNNGSDFADKLRSLPTVHSVLPFTEHNVLLRGRQSNPRGALVRGVPPQAMELDPGLALKIEIEDGYFDLSDPLNIVLGAELAYFLSAKVGDEVNLLSITGAFRDEQASNIFKVSGIFLSGFYEYDLGWAFININTASELTAPLEPEIALDQMLLSDETERRSDYVLGIKLNNRWQDLKALYEIEKFIAGYNSQNMAGNKTNGSPDNMEGVSIRSWRDYNRSFFRALRTEKLMMFILVGLIFIVVGLNIFQAQRRVVLERQEEIGLLRALGAKVMAVRLIFVLDGFIIGLAGACIGLVPGLLISFNIQPFFTFLERAVNIIIYFINFIFGFLSALLAAWFASGKVSAATPTEVLRYE